MGALELLWMHPHFNPRSREGSDMLIFPWTFYDHDFNPRSREGSDLSGQISFSDLEISIHAPARGATKTVVRENRIPFISIHAPARGATSLLQ